MVWALDKLTVTPGQGSTDGDNLSYAITVQNALKTGALQGTIDLPEATKKLLQWPYGTTDMQVKVFNRYYKDLRNTVYATMPTFQIDLMNFWKEEANTKIHFGLMCDANTDFVEPASANGTLYSMPIAIPDEATVQALATEYGIKYDETLGGYVFPVNWAELGTDISYSKDGNGNVVPVSIDRFALTNSSNVKYDFAETVDLQDGW